MATFRSGLRLALACSYEDLGSRCRPFKQRPGPPERRGSVSTWPNGNGILAMPVQRDAESAGRRERDGMLAAPSGHRPFTRSRYARYALRGGRSVFLFVWAADAERRIPDHDPVAQKAAERDGRVTISSKRWIPPTTSTSILCVRFGPIDGRVVPDRRRGILSFTAGWRRCIAPDGGRPPSGCRAEKTMAPGPRLSRIRAQIQTLHRRQAELCGTIRYVVCAEDPVWHSCAKFRDQVDLITAACKVDDEPYHFRSIFPRSRRARVRPR
jgi:hypothetical protein